MMLNFPYMYLLAGALILFLLSLSLFYFLATRPRSGTVEWIQLREEVGPFRFYGGRHRLEGWDDVLIIVLIMALWATITFWNLGDREAPQSFQRFESTDQVEINLGQEADIQRVFFYTGLHTGEYELAFSQDGLNWVPQGPMLQDFANLFKWREAHILDGDQVRHIRLGVQEGPLYLGELAVYDTQGRLDPVAFSLQWSNPAHASDALFDEQDVVPERASHLNSAYFDEIYHARTAYEHLTGVYPYEISHPPLGKVIISLGIHLFGMTPFGWRFMGALMGVFILGILYCLIKGMFGNRLVAVCGTLVFAFDFMHFSQTRIATIDTYAVLFVLLQFWFLYRYISQDYETPFRKTLPSLFFTGLFFGLGAASKWTSLFFAPALVLLFFIYQHLRRGHWRKLERQKEFSAYMVKTIAICFVFFLIIPGIIYYLSYIPYGRAVGHGPFSLDYLNLVVENQRFMFTYHAGVYADHPFASRWWQWIFNLRPILYYLSFLPDGTRSAISAFGNPLVYWGGLLAMLSMPVMAITRKDGRPLAIFLGYISLLLPWIFITRPAFAYHYFINTLFLALAISYIFHRLVQRNRGPYRAAILTFVGVCMALFVLFYPALSGLPIPVWYSERLLQWFPTWPI